MTVLGSAFQLVGQFPDRARGSLRFTQHVLQTEYDGRAGIGDFLAGLLYAGDAGIGPGDDGVQVGKVTADDKLVHAVNNLNEALIKIDQIAAKPNQGIDPLA